MGFCFTQPALLYGVYLQPYSFTLYMADAEPPGDTLDLVASAIGLVMVSGFPREPALGSF